ncbi:MAG: Hcp family type VI secretion system effector [Thermomicrobiales bacterium]
MADYFLKIDGIEGESTDAKHKGEIEIESFSWGATNNASAAHGGGGGSGKVSVQDFHFVMHFNKASPKLFFGAASGEHFKKAVLTARKAGERQLDYLKWTLSDCLVSSYQTGATSIAVPESVAGAEEPSPEVAAVRNAKAPMPVDEFSLDFAKLEVSYQTQNADGGLGTPETAGWDFRSQKGS